MSIADVPWGSAPAMPRVRRRWRAAVSAAALAAAFTAASPVAIAAAAGPTVTVTPSVVPVGPGQTLATVTVGWSGQAAGKQLFVQQCWAPTTAPQFDRLRDCSFESLKLVNGALNQGSGSMSFPLFRGSEPSGDRPIGCFAPGDSVPAGVTGYTTCYVRVTNNQGDNAVDQVSAPFTFAAPSAAPATTTPAAPPATVAPVVPRGGAAASAGAAPGTPVARGAVAGATISTSPAVAGSGVERLPRTGSSTRLLTALGLLLVGLGLLCRNAGRSAGAARRLH